MIGLTLERRVEAGPWALLLAPVLAVALTVASSIVIFWLLGQDPWRALSVYFILPLADSWSLQEVAVKAAPLVMISVGLALCFRSNNWNIGAEGQFLIGAICGGGVAVWTHGQGGLCHDPGAARCEAAGQRDPRLAAAGLCGRVAARLSRARSVA